MLYVEWENAICRMTISCTVWYTLFECSITRPLFACKQCQAAGAAKQRTGQLVHGCAEKHRGRTSPPSAHEHASAPDTAARPRRFWFVGYDQLQSRARRCTIFGLPHNSTTSSRREFAVQQLVLSRMPARINASTHWK